MRNVAVVAHFDAENYVSDNFVNILLCISEIFDKVIVVTTSDINLELRVELPKVEVIKRPNIGYDFYSYRVGLSVVYRIKDLENVLLVNSSFVLLEPRRFTMALRTMITLNTQNDVVGATSSTQIDWHIQSYLLLIGRKVLTSTWFRNFIDEIEPLNTKIETILRYEIGLSQALISKGMRVVTLFQPSRHQLADARRLWKKYLAGKPDLAVPVRLNLRSHMRNMREMNPAHFLAEPIARELGYVKMEVLRDNQFGVNVDFVSQLASGVELEDINNLVARARQHYTTGGDNITTLSIGRSFLPYARTAQWGVPHSPGVELAVVLHLYYSDLLEDICKLLINIIKPFDLFITTPFEGDVTRIFNRCSLLAQSVSVSISENRGRDIGPFVRLYRSGILDGYRAVLKIHTKKSKYSDSGDAWRDALYRGVVGDSLTVQRILRLLASGDIGIVGPHSYYLTNENFWGANRENMRRLLTAMVLIDQDEEPELGFFAGSMFWFAPEALRPLQTIPESELNFEPEAGLQDGTLAHALERLFCPIARKTGYHTTSVILQGGEIHEAHTLGNNVPVLSRQ
ncbi:rhamnan synthesis F family protein [Mesorhizobium sp.]|uniref:rhamnan synthesis F family protein n=1 Tax=Mesorhizobium sp. TaxID=1871066 RepID=UPI0025B8673A|nr:rhamnan synthesis F family protein [Mesorhizobium sp.]